MKRKLLLALITVLMVLSCAVGFTACNQGGASAAKGTYYLFMGDTLDKSQYITLDGNNWTDEEGDSGEYSISGDNIVLYEMLDGEKEEIAVGTVKDGVLTLNILGIPLVYCKEGVTPPEGGEQPQEKYSVTYDANGGKFEGGETTFLQSDIPSGALLTAPASPERTGFSFAGWSKNKNGSDLWMFDTDRVSKNVTLYAVWTQKSGVIVSVDGASIDGTNVFMLVDPSVDSVSLASKVVCSEDSTWKLYYDKLGQMEIPTKIAAGQAGVLEEGNNIFYIVVTSGDGTQVNTYQLTVHRSYQVSVRYYDGDELLKTDSVYTGNKYTADYVPQISGYTFNGWKTADGTAFREATVLGSFSLYADKTANEYEAELDVNGGEELSQTTFTMTYGSHYTFPVPEREGYTFLGWYDGGTKLTDEEGKSVYAWSYAQDMTLQAKWEAIEYDVTLYMSDAEAGKVTGGGAHAYDSEVTVTAVTNDGYTWLGWYDEDNGFITDEESFTFRMKYDVSYYAEWTYYTVTTGKNITAAGKITEYLNEKVTVGKTVTLTAQTYSGYTFLGWYDGEVQLSDELTYSFEMKTKNVKYIAQWMKSTVTVSSSDESIGTVSGFDDSDNILGNTVEVTATKQNLGYNFLGWYKNDELLSQEYTISFTVTETPAEYTAKYEKDRAMSAFRFTSTQTTCEITKVSNEYLTEITVPDYVTSIAAGAFNGCGYLESLTLPFVGGSRKSPNDTYQYPFGYIFGTQSYTGGTSVTQRYYGSKTYMKDSMTYYIPLKLSSVTITGGEILSGAFENCGMLESITLPERMTYLGDNAFNYCARLGSITIPDGVTSIGEFAFHHCDSLVSVTIPDGMKSIESNAFVFCGSLVSVTIPDGVTSIGDDAFSTCTSLVSITIPDSVTSIEDGVFSSCSSLVSITIPDHVTSIGGSAFYNCKALVSITIPESVTSIGKYAFSDCTSLTSVTFENTSGWQRCDSDTSTSGISIDSSSLADPSTAATYLKSTYYLSYWKRS